MIKIIKREQKDLMKTLVELELRSTLEDDKTYKAYLEGQIKAYSGMLTILDEMEEEVK